MSVNVTIKTSEESPLIIFKVGDFFFTEKPCCDSEHSRDSIDNRSSVEKIGFSKKKSKFQLD